MNAEPSNSAAYPYLEEALPGFHRGRAVVKAAGDSLAGLGFIGTKFDFYRFANRLRLAACFGGLRWISDLKFEISDPLMPASATCSPTGI